MSVLSLPNAKFRAANFGLVSNVDGFSSPLSGSVQTVELPGARWKGRFELPPLDVEDAVEWKVFFMQLRGGGKRFYGYDPDPRFPRGIATGTPLVDGGSQTGTTLDTKGWTTGQTGILKKGDYFAYDTSNGRQMHMVTADADSDGLGLATLEFEPPIRTSPADDAALLISPASCQMIPVQNEALWDLDVNLLYGMSFEAIEAFGTYT